MAAPVKSTPRDAQVMSAILKDAGVLEHEPRLVNQMLEFTYRYITDVLDDAKVYSSHANKKSIDSDDVRIAVQCRMDNSFTSPPPRDLLMEIARQKNNVSLPLIKPYTGPKLPPDRYCLAAPNYKLSSNRAAKKTHRIIGLHSIAGGQRMNLTPLQNKAKIVSGGANIPNLANIMSKSVTTPTMTVHKSQAAPNTGQPTVRVSQGLLSTVKMETTPGIVPEMISGSQHGSMPGLVPQGQPTSLMSTNPLPTTLMSTNPLKRKHEWDDCEID